MSDKSRRKLLKSIAAGSGAIVAGKSLPESWSKPVVDSVMLPAHAQTSIAPPPPAAPTTFTDTQTISHDFTNTKTLNVNFNVTGFTPSGDGTLALTLDDDFNSSAETATITVDGQSFPNNVLFSVTGAGNQCSASPQQNLTIPQAILQTAASDGTVTISIEAATNVNACSGATDQVVQLQFPS